MSRHYNKWLTEFDPFRDVKKIKKALNRQWKPCQKKKKIRQPAVSSKRNGSEQMFDRTPKTKAVKINLAEGIVTKSWSNNDKSQKKNRENIANYQRKLVKSQRFFVFSGKPDVIRHRFPIKKLGLSGAKTASYRQKIHIWLQRKKALEGENNARRKSQMSDLG